MSLLDDNSIITPRYAMLGYVARAMVWYLFVCVTGYAHVDALMLMLMLYFFVIHLSSLITPSFHQCSFCNAHAVRCNHCYTESPPFPFPLPFQPSPPSSNQHPLYANRYAFLCIVRSFTFIRECPAPLCLGDINQKPMDQPTTRRHAVHCKRTKPRRERNQRNQKKKSGKNNDSAGKEPERSKTRRTREPKEKPDPRLSCAPPDHPSLFPVLRPPPNRTEKAQETS